MVPGKLGLSQVKLKVLVGRAPTGRFAAGIATGTLLTATNHDHVRRHRDVHGGSKAVDAVGVHRKPASGVEQVTGVVADVGQFQSLHRTVVGGIENAFVFESKRGRTVLRDRSSERDANRGVLRDTLGAQRLARSIDHFGYAQRVVQFERGDIQIFESGKLYLGMGADFVGVGREFGVDLVIVHAQAHLLRRPRWH